MNKLLLLAGLVASGSVMATAAPAAAPVSILPTLDTHNSPHGWYAGAGAVMPESINVKIHHSNNNSNLALDNSPFGFSLLAGYRLTPFFGSEGGYTYLSETTWRDRDDNTTLKANQNFKFYYDGLVFLPIASGFELFGKAGLSFIHQNNDCTDHGIRTQQVNSFALNYGVGMGYNYQQYGVSFDYTKYQPSTNVNNDTVISDLVSLNVKYYFG